MHGVDYRSRGCQFEYWEELKKNSIIKSLVIVLMGCGDWCIWKLEGVCFFASEVFV